ncbi:MAG TPA: tRNA pseudouridine(38-40) synthase TruA [Steroidobacteraceae bacterium]|nr:tRNA pseudouridine(38-40) synthase TruA [Steroidobacteraceae bacterium]
MPRFAAGIEYDGRAYSGWQHQPGLQTVQGTLQAALSRVADSPVECTCAGRTDAGVHALAQVVHFDSDAARGERGFRLGANTYLPGDVAVVWLREVPGHFHARYSAGARSYRYVILNRDSRPGLAAGRATWERRPLDAQRMHDAARCLIGEHDFSAFRAIECQAKSPVRHVEALSVERAEEWVTLSITANAFLHHMVRNIAGLLISVGEGTSPPERVARVLAGRDRKQSAATAPPDGLYLESVRYPVEFGLPSPTVGSGLSSPGTQSAMIGRSRE